jgi:hypothetical protein
MAIILTSIFNGQDNAKAEKGKKQKTLRMEINKKIENDRKKSSLQMALNALKMFANGVNKKRSYKSFDL